MLVLCEKLSYIHSDLYEYEKTVSVQDLADFVKIEFERVGADVNITPREVIRDFIELLDLMYQHKDMSIADLLSSDEFSYAKSDAVSNETSDLYTEFTI